MRKFIGIIIGLLLVSLSNSSICHAMQNAEEINSNQKTISATEIDLGNYQSSMLIGEKQLLTVTVLPADTTDQILSYQSSNESVATINGMGRITAVSAGTTQITITCGSIQNGFQLEVKQSNNVVVTNIEIGNYETEMVVGKNQIISATVLPSNATSTTLSYESSDTKIATVLSTGEIKAVAAGTTTITVSAGTITKSISIIVKEPEKATEIDLGDYEETMVIGGKQLISATVLPTTAADQTLTYQSGDENVATINEMGRITAMSVGTTKITVSCGTVQNSFQLTVKKSNDIAVTDIEIENYEKEMYVDKTQILSTTVKPSNATDTTVDYSSSDTAVVTVLSSGELKGIGPGTATITCKAGDISKSIQIVVKEATAKIEINNNYVVLKPKGEFQLKATVHPSNATQSVTYKSANSDIATVSVGGTIKAHSIGITSVLVSNGDLSTAVTVIVNESGVAEKSEKETESVATASENVEGLSEQEAVLIDQIKNTKDSVIEINTADYTIIRKNILKALYETKQVLLIKGNDYTIRIDGNNIVNYENELNTQIQFMKEEEGFSFIINENKNLPGSIELTLLDSSNTGKYLYLYNQIQKKYQIIKSDKNISDLLFLDTTGKYLLTDEKISTARVGIAILMILGIGILIVGGVYIGVKKKYWFW